VNCLQIISFMDGVPLQISARIKWITRWIPLLSIWCWTKELCRNAFSAYGTENVYGAYSTKAEVCCLRKNTGLL